MLGSLQHACQFSQSGHTQSIGFNSIQTAIIINLIPIVFVTIGARNHFVLPNLRWNKSFNFTDNATIPRKQISGAFSRCRGTCIATEPIWFLPGISRDDPCVDHRPCLRISQHSEGLRPAKFFTERCVTVLRFHAE